MWCSSSSGFGVFRQTITPSDRKPSSTSFIPHIFIWLKKSSWDEVTTLPIHSVVGGGDWTAAIVAIAATMMKMILFIYSLSIM
jgi:hypothetical protein